MRLNQPTKWYATARVDKSGRISMPCLWGPRVSDCIPDDDEQIVRVVLMVTGTGIRRRPRARRSETR
jgi:hypothetical protein